MNSLYEDVIPGNRSENKRIEDGFGGNCVLFPQ